MLFTPHIQSTIRNFQYQMRSDIQQVMSILSVDSTPFLLYQTTQCSFSPACCHYQLCCCQYKNKCDWNGSGCIKMLSSSFIKRMQLLSLYTPTSPKIHSACNALLYIFVWDHTHTMNYGQLPSDCCRICCGFPSLS